MAVGIMMCPGVTVNSGGNGVPVTCLNGVGNDVIVGGSVGGTDRGRVGSVGGSLGTPTMLLPCLTISRGDYNSPSSSSLD